MSRPSSRAMTAVARAWLLCTAPQVMIVSQPFSRASARRKLSLRTCGAVSQGIDCMRQVFEAGA